MGSCTEDEDPGGGEALVLGLLVSIVIPLYFNRASTCCDAFLPIS